MRRESVQRHESLVLIIQEGATFPRVTTRLRNRGDDRARGLLVFRLEIVRNDAEFLNGVAGKRIAAARVLSGDATRDDVILVALTIDEEVHLLRRLRAGAELLARSIDAIWRDVHARCELREVEDVAARSRQLRDLLLRNVRRRFRRPRLDGATRPGNRHCGKLLGASGQRKVIAQYLTDLHQDVSRHFLKTDSSRRHGVCRRAKRVQRVKAFRIANGVSGETRRAIDGGHCRIWNGCAISAAHVAADGTGVRLRVGARSGKKCDGRERET